MILKNNNQVKNEALLQSPDLELIAGNIDSYQTDNIFALDMFF